MQASESAPAFSLLSHAQGALALEPVATGARYADGGETAPPAAPLAAPYSIRSRAYHSGWFDLICFAVLLCIAGVALFV